MGFPRWLNLLILTIIGLVLLIASLSTIELEDFISAMHRLKLEMVIMSTISFLLYYLFRGIRWVILLRPVKNSVSLINTFRITIIGYFVNTLIPIRVGEFARAILLNRKERVGVFEGLSSIAVERVLDLFSISLIGLIAVSFLPPNIPYPSWFIDSLYLVFILALAMILVIVFATVMQIEIIGFIERLLKRASIIPSKWREKLLNIMKSILEGASGLNQRPSLVALSLILSLVIWVMYALFLYFIFEAFTYRLHWSMWMLGAALMAISFAFPAAPGFVGTFEATWMIVFSFGLKLPAEITMPIGIFAHIIDVLVAVIPGYLCVLWMGIKSKELLSQPRRD
ncbi:MAG: lysylphosphatidylglycerol synthase transmembrane domain-containing protein [Nitrososphaerota archaeon]|nr:flippase-like domain-containing protein [Nitrososphaerales archaeon]MDW8045462.1 lysylphosphatidylglycerol synthase transmembrane domain-containing protein [Nitrososphaerota archaeon]